MAERGELGGEEGGRVRFRVFIFFFFFVAVVPVLGVAFSGGGRGWFGVLVVVGR